MKKLFALLIPLALLLCLCACAGGDGGLQNLNLVSEYTRDLEGTKLNVYNWGEYISETRQMHVVKAFRALTGIKVSYTNFDTNEDLYVKLAAGGAGYDVIFPSDYMIQRLIAEDRLEEIDFANIPNYKYILDDYKSLYFDPQDKYSVPYTMGMVGLLYNSTLVKEPPDSWAALWDPRYAGQILQFSSSRDAFGTAQYLLGQDINSLNPADWDAAANKLKQQAPLVQDYVSDEIYDILGPGNAILAPYYAGDFLMMQAENPDLAFAYPKEGTNFFYDSICIPKGARNIPAAELFINFMLEPDVALANAETIMYASPHRAVQENPAYSLKGNEFLYPSAMPITQIFKHLPKGTQTLMNKLWMEVQHTK